VIKYLLLFALSLNAMSFYPKKDLKVLVLIIASDQYPLYTELQEHWRSYMHYDPEHVEAYFIKGDVNLDCPYKIENDIIWSRTDEGWPPQSAGIINKTIYSLEAMQPRLHEFDYVLRTNLSSFYNFPNLLKALENLPRKNCLFASTFAEGYISGSGFIMSTDVVQKLIKGKKKFIDRKEFDDVLIGQYLKRKKVPIITHSRVDLLTFNDWLNVDIPEDAFHFRIKMEDRDAPRVKNCEGMSEEIYIHQKLLEKYYTK
jgi:hypothetical protein